MKRFIYLIILLLPLVNGCTKAGSSSAVEKFDRYIFFSQGVDTKVSLIEKKEDLSGHTFGVVGFKYDNTSSWDAVKTSATPNVFRDATGNLVETEMLTCSADGTATYAPIQGWSNTKKFSFFAYYPFENQNVTLVNLDGTPYTGGTPAIKYTMNTADPAASMVDVMIASHTNLDGSSSQVTSTDVTFNFQHCLSCLGMKVKNSSAGNITIKSVYLNPSKLVNNEIIIPLDGSDAEPIQALSEFSEAEIFTTEESIEPSNERVLTDKLIFIPQEEEIEVQVVVSYVREAVNGYPALEGSFASVPLKTKLSIGKKHLIHLNFTESTVDVVGEVDENGWIDVPSVDNSFN